MTTGYYVSIIRSSRQRGLLLGPYRTHRAAELAVDDGRALAVAADPWAEFDAFGTCRLDRSGPLPVGVFGDGEPRLF